LKVGRSTCRGKGGGRRIVISLLLMDLVFIPHSYCMASPVLGMALPHGSLFSLMCLAGPLLACVGGKAMLSCHSLLCPLLLVSSCRTSFQDLNWAYRKTGHSHDTSLNSQEPRCGEWVSGLIFCTT
jgi:hypothetical protein